MSRHNEHGRRKFPAGMMPPRSERERATYETYYYDVPPVPTAPAKRATISDADMRLQQAREYGQRRTLRYEPHADGRPGGRITPIAQPQRKPDAELIRTLLADKGDVEAARILERAGLKAGPEATPQQREAVAIEEAAHAVQSHAVGVHVREIFINRTISGQCTNELATLPGTGWREKLTRAASVFLAGKIAQKIKYGHVVVAGHQSDDKAVADFLVVAGNERAAVLAEAERFTQETLRARWDDVERVAKALRERGTLSGDEFRKLVPAVQVRRVQLPMATRSAAVQAAGGDEFDVVFSAGATVRRRDAYNEAYDEELLMGADNVDMTRLASGTAPFLSNHDATDIRSVLGVVTSAKLENGIGLARVRLSSRDDVQPIAQDVRDKILRNVSVGYAVLAGQRVQRSDDVPLMRVTRWRPAEVSLVAIGADPDARVRTFEAEISG